LGWGELLKWNKVAPWHGKTCCDVNKTHKKGEVCLIALIQCIIFSLIIFHCGKHNFLQIGVFLFVSHYVCKFQRSWMLKKGGSLVFCFGVTWACMFINIVDCSLWPTRILGQQLVWGILWSQKACAMLNLQRRRNMSMKGGIKQGN
jgi:hypothetical protein